MTDAVKDFYVHYYEVDYFKRATPWTFINYLQETAFTHSDLAGDTQDLLASDELTWMVYKWRVCIDEYPYWKETVKVRTWLSSIKSYKAIREFEISNQAGRILVKATAECILVDTVKLVPRRIDRGRKEAYGTREPALNIQIPAIADEDIESNIEKVFQVRISDIDSNGHVNNARYLDWFIESIPVDILKGYSLHMLEVTYKRQVTFGQDITVQCSEECPDSDEKIFSGIIRDEEGQRCAFLKGVFIPG